LETLEKRFEQHRTLIQRLREGIRQVIVGQESTVEEVLSALFAGGHALILGVPGLAKTLLVKTLAALMDLKFSRIQFTPDLMPLDILGTTLIEQDPATGEKRFRFVPGPVFAHVILADEINRTPPKTQAALLEAMQERRVTVEGRTFVLEDPFFVLATQNPIEQEGTYPLPEAQLDRFLCEIRMDYPSEEEEREILRLTTREMDRPLPQPVAKREDILALQAFVREIPFPDHLLAGVVRLVRATRPGHGAPEIVNRYVAFGAGPRAGQALILLAKARALYQGRAVPTREDVERMILPALRHRITLNFRAEAEGITPDGLIRELLKLDFFTP